MIEKGHAAAKAATATKKASAAKAASKKKKGKAKEAAAAAATLEAKSPTMGGALKHGQFFHEACYAAQASMVKGRTSETGRMKARAMNVIGELLRLKKANNEYVRHLLKEGLTPKPPRHLAGVHPEELVAAWEDIKSAAKFQVEEKVLPDGSVQYAKQRSTATILGASVASWPGPADPGDPQYVLWCDLVVAFAKRRYGKHFLGAYEHSDEKCGHIHMLFADGGRNVKPLMAGPRAAAQALAEGATPAEAQEALVEANKRLQDEFHEAVGRHVGLDRLGPNPQPRKSMSQAHAKAALDDDMAQLRAQLAEQVQRVLDLQAQAEERERRIAAAERRADKAEEQAASERAYNAQAQREKSQMQLAMEEALAKQRADAAKALAEKDREIEEQAKQLAAAEKAQLFAEASRQLLQEDPEQFEPVLKKVAGRAVALRKT